MTPFRFARGSTPLLISVPHCGTYVPEDIADRMTEAGRAVPDTDWNVDRLYDFARKLGASMLIATHSRFVVDLNRPPDGKPLYPGASNTELCPLQTFESEPIYRTGQEPTPAEIEARREAYWQPYHDTLNGILERLVRTYGVAMLWDGHSIKSVLPRFFEGKLTDLNLGTGSGSACDPALAQQLLGIAGQASNWTSVLNGRFTGGYITRRYGRPAENIHAVQLELCWSTYMDEAPPWRWQPELAAPLQQTVLQPMIEAVLAWAEQHRTAA